jgi:pyrroloquinoline quinone biosynthesis protein B
MRKRAPAGLSRREFVTTIGTAIVCNPTARHTPKGQESEPYAMILGMAQDGGLPQIGGYSPRCEDARQDPRYVASLALVHPGLNRFYLVDATPSITQQVDLINEPAFRRRAQERQPFDGIFLTHAHMGHYLGLALLGREGLGMGPTPVYCTLRMREYLTSNGPWSLMVQEQRLDFADVPVDLWFTVDDWLSVRMIPVPHRPEFSDTVAFMFRGPRATVLYVPDIDRWESWDHSIQELARNSDAALIDGSFYSGDEVPGRRIEDIPHPLIPHSMELLQSAVDGGSRVIFTHLNNTNPAHDDGPARAAIVQRGFEVARQGTRIGI